MHEDPAAADGLVERRVNREGRFRHDVLVVEVAHDPDDAARLGAEVDELADGIGEHHAAIDDFLIGEHAAGDALADDHDRFAAAPIAFVEVASGDQGDAQRVEEAGRHGPELGARILFTVGAHVPFGGELEPGPRVADVTPGHRGAHRHAIDARHRGNPVQHVAIEREGLIGCPARAHHRDVERQDVARIEAALVRSAARAAS